MLNEHHTITHDGMQALTLITITAESVVYDRSVESNTLVNKIARQMWKLMLETHHEIMCGCVVILLKWVIREGASSKAIKSAPEVTGSPRRWSRRCLINCCVGAHYLHHFTHHDQVNKHQQAERLFACEWECRHPQGSHASKHWPQPRLNR